jgi:hypothetical protein
MKWQELVVIIFLMLFFLQSALANGNVEILENGFSIPRNLLHLNSAADDFAPSYNPYMDVIYFNSTRTGYSKFYQIDYVDSTALTNITNITLSKSALNTRNKNVSYITMLNATEALVSDFEPSNIGSFLNIKKTLYQQNAWSVPAIQKEFSDTVFIAHPTYDTISRTLVFVSNKGNADGTTDLWYAALLDDGSWNMIMPITELNSNGNEITPYLANDTLLIFASDGFGGTGGFDLYYTTFYDGKWDKPLPLTDVNTEWNESDPLLLQSGELIFSSDRPGGLGGLDLYLSDTKDAGTKRRKL